MRAQQQSKRALWLATRPSVGARNADTRFAIVQSPRRPLLALMGPTLNAKIDGTSAAFVDVAMKSARFVALALWRGIPAPGARLATQSQLRHNASSRGRVTARIESA
jgi:hypothetical protein